MRKRYKILILLVVSLSLIVLVYRWAMFRYDVASDLRPNELGVSIGLFKYAGCTDLGIIQVDYVRGDMYYVLIHGRCSPDRVEEYFAREDIRAIFTQPADGSEEESNAMQQMRELLHDADRLDLMLGDDASYVFGIDKPGLAMIHWSSETGELRYHKRTTKPLVIRGEPVGRH